MSMNTFDLIAVVVVVAGTCAWLVSRFRSPKPPACHQMAPDVDAGGDTVVMGASLAKGVQRARLKEERARKSEKRVNA